MAVANQPALPPGASSKGVGRGRCARVLFNSADRSRKKLITKLNNLFYVCNSYSTSTAPKTMELHFLHTSCSLHLPSILLSITTTCVWLVVAFKTVDQQPFKAAVCFIFVSFLLLNSTPQTMGPCAPTRSSPSALKLNTTRVSNVTLA